ncbi:MAG: SurA N-terminal domain-containing protein [Muribaculaceae bacterium]|nr:SurA N-terminal domain-containing protein [Muribaculaceae bacterium]
MATLEKIRKRSALLFTIIIVALLAFILGDFLTSGRSFFGHGTTMAKVDGHKIDYTQVSERAEMLSQQAQAQGQTIDGETVRQMAIQQLLTEALLDQELSDLGITVSDAEITAGMTSEIPHPAAQQFIYQMSQSLGLQSMSGQAVFDAVSNPAKYGITDPSMQQQLRAMWAAQEDQLENAIRHEKFSRMIAGLFTANPIDADALYNERNTTAHITYAAKDFTSIPDEEISVSDEEIRNEWNKNKERFRLGEPSREVSFIVVPIEPSAEDLRAADATVREAIATLRTDSTGVGSVQNNPAFVVNRISTPMRNIQNPILRAYLDSARVGQVQQLIHNNQGYTIAKLINKPHHTDSGQLSFALFADDNTRDSVLAKINTGELTLSEYIKTNRAGQDSIWDVLATSQAPASLAATITEAPYGKLVTYNDSIMGQDGSYIQRSMLVKVYERKAPAAVYDVAVIEYAVDPSQETVNKLTSDLRKYITDNPTAAQFSANAAEAGYNLQNSIVGSSSAQLGESMYGMGLSDSRALVKWAMDNNKGDVSPIYQDKKQSYLAAIAIDNLYDEYVPYTSSDIKESITTKLRNDKKAQKLIDQYAGKANDVAGYAQLMGTEANTTDVNFASHMFGNLGVNENTLQGLAAASPKGKLVGPAKGNTRVVVFTIDSVDVEGRPNDFKENAAEFDRTQGFSVIFNNANLLNVLRGRHEITNYSLDFENPGL